MRRVPTAPMPLLVTALLCGAGPDARAGDAPGGRTLPNRTVELFVHGAGGSYEIGVHPDVVTVLYLPEPVIKVFASDQRRFDLHPVASTVAVRPRPGDLGSRGSISIDTPSLHLALVVKLVAFDEARAQVFFRREDQPLLDAQCQSRVASLGREVEEAKAGLAAEVETRAAVRVARALAQSAAVTRARGNTIARNEQGIVLWAESVVRLGDDVWLRVGVENRSRTPFVVGDVEVTGAGVAPVRVIAGWDRAEIAFDDHAFGALRLPRGPDGRVPSPLGVVVREPRLGRDVSLSGVRLDAE